jgi:signal transduction histidine kinase
MTSDWLAREQAAFRRVATLVARGLRPGDIYTAVSKEVGRLFDCEAGIARYEPDGSAMIVVGLTQGFPVVAIGARLELEDFPASTAVVGTGSAPRSGHAAAHAASGLVAERLRRMGFVSTVDAPIVVDGSLWGVMTVSHLRESLPAETEERLEKFTELVATAIANAESRAELAASEARARNLAEEQAALRRVATLAARGVLPDELLAAVTREARRVLPVETANLGRYEPDNTMTIVAASPGKTLPVGSRWPLGGDNVSTAVARTGRPFRIDHYRDATGPIADAVREHQRSRVAAGAPIVVQGRLWGVMIVTSFLDPPLPADIEARLADFTELVATAIANAESRAELAASEARTRNLAEEQAALRRVATLAARGVLPDELLAAATREARRVLPVEFANLGRYEPDGTMTFVAASPEQGTLPVGSRFPLGGDNVSTAVARTGRPVRIDHYPDATGPIADAVRDQLGPRVAAGAPIVVEGRLWGVMVVSSTGDRALPANIEARLAAFTELVATAIANAENHAALARLLDEQGSLRRVATLVAKRGEVGEVFSAVAEEVRRMFGVQFVTVCRYDPDDMLVLSCAGVAAFPPGSRWPLDVPSLPGTICKTGVAARIDEFGEASGLDALARDAGVSGAVGAPILVDGRVWGSIIVAATDGAPLERDVEERLARFTDLIATSVSNATMRAELAASRARVIAAADEARRRIERDLHDGAQQRLITLAVALRRAEGSIPAGEDALRTQVARVADGLRGAAEELQEMSRGIHPSVVSNHGLSPALKALGRRSHVPVKLDLRVDRRLPDQVEVAAYYIVSEALTNAAKHAGATRVWVSVRIDEDPLCLSIRDDGVGGADPTRGSGLIGLKDRVEAIGGKISIESPPRQGTRIEVELPVAPTRGADAATSAAAAPRAARA